jgi:hypothetical protein
VPETHAYVKDTFTKKVNEIDWLKQHRDYIESNHLGFGCRSFWWQWYLLFRDLYSPCTLNLLEIGVHKGAVLSLWALIAKMRSQSIAIHGITPTDGAETGITNTLDEIHQLISKYSDDVTCKVDLHKGYSQDESSILFAQRKLYHIVYIDGGHTSEIVSNDIANYASLVTIGGYLVMDDCANVFKQPWGYFQGIQSVSDVVDSVLPPITPSYKWEHVGVVMHNRVWRRLS